MESVEQLLCTYRTELAAMDHEPEEDRIVTNLVFSPKQLLLWESQDVRVVCAMKPGLTEDVLARMMVRLFNSHTIGLIVVSYLGKEDLTAEMIGGVKTTLDEKVNVESLAKLIDVFAGRHGHL